MTKPTPVLFVIDHFRNPQAGTEGQLFNLISHLDRDRFEPTLLVFSESEYLKTQGFPCNYRVLGHSRLLSPKTWRELWRFARYYRGRGGRLAHVFFNDSSVVCPPVFWANGIKTLISRRDMGYWYTPLYRIMLIVTGRFVAGVITNSNAVRLETAKQELISPERFSVIYNGYDASSDTLQSPPMEDPDVDIRTRTGVNAVLVGLVANIRPIKRMEDAIEALALLKDKGSLLHLVVIGAGDAGELSQLAEERGISANVHFVGAQSNIKQWLQAMDIGVLCSESEGFSNAIIEYMQAGLPVVCSDVGGNPEAISDSETGFLYPMGDVKALAFCLDRLAVDPVMRERIGKNARAIAQSRFGMVTMVKAHQKLYDQLLDS